MNITPKFLAEMLLANLKVPAGVRTRSLGRSGSYYLIEIATIQSIKYRRCRRYTPWITIAIVTSEHLLVFKNGASNPYQVEYYDRTIQDQLQTHFDTYVDQGS